jgi:hypothetical protein
MKPEGHLMFLKQIEQRQEGIKDETDKIFPKLKT